MLAHNQRTYGALEGQEVEENKSISQRLGVKYVVAFAAVALMTAGVVVLSAKSGVSHGQVATVADANRNRATIAVVDHEVRELGMKVLNMTVNGLRWAVFGFDRRREKIIPLTAGPATADWEKDFAMFRNALPEGAAAVGVYNFEYWVDNESTGVEPIMITWAPKILSPMEEARAGYYLPGVILALNTDEGRVNTERMDTGVKNDAIGKQKKGYAGYEHTGFSGPYRLDQISESYAMFCSTEMGLPQKDCDLEKGFHNCPFQSENEEEWTPSNPCLHEVCAGDSFQRPEGAMPGTISQACCDYVEKEYCSAPENYGTMGCHAVTLAAIDKLCDVPQPAEPVIQEFNWSEEARCSTMCAQPCNTFLKPEKTWQNCEGCRMDLMPDDNAENAGQISQCYPGAVGYEMNTCCGAALTADGAYFCEQAEYLTAEMCNMLEYYECQWIPQIDCPELKRSQDIADSPTGCCYMPNENPDPDLFGTDSAFNFVEDQEVWDFTTGTVDEPIPQVLCGGGKYADAEDKSVFVEGKSCQEVKEGFEFLLQKFQEENAGGETTPAARV